MAPLPQHDGPLPRAESARLVALLLASCASLACCSWLLAGTSASAQESDSLPPNEFNIDLVSGPIAGSGRIIGLGGAYTALGYGADGAAWTPAAYAVRSLWDHDWFVWDVTFDYSPGAFRGTDYDNDGRAGFTYDDYLFLTLGGGVQLGAAGLGGLVRIQDYRIGDGASLALVVANYGAGYAFLDGQLMIGLAARTAWLTVSARQSGATLVHYDGTGPELGALLALEDKPYRVGIAARLAVGAEKGSSTQVAAGLALPQRLVLPAEAQLGFAYQFGSRPLNRRWVNPHVLEEKLRRALLARREARQRAHELESARAHPAPSDTEFWTEEARLRSLEERDLLRALEEQRVRRAAEVDALSRRYLLLSAETIVIGRTDSAVGLESFLNQRRQTAGSDVSIGFRLGAETEPIEGRLKVRAGTYLEPSRFAGVPYRGHGTLATDLRLFRWDLLGLVEPFDLRIGAFIDLAPRYTNFGFSLGVWH